MSGRLVCAIQRYAWGDRLVIPELLGEPADGEPQAELWMGAHPMAPSLLYGRPLDALIAEAPLDFLGPDVADRFGQLPLLFKVLAVAHPLSIQVHPSIDQARDGFSREDSLGIALDAPERIYRDPNHKPELVCALTRFEAKCGLRPVPETLALLEELRCSALDPLRDILLGGVTSAGGDRVELSPMQPRLIERPEPQEAALAQALNWLLDLEAGEAAALTDEVVRAALSDIPASSPFATDRRACAALQEAHPGDIGVVVALLLNHVVLAPGDALYLEPGVPHAYLSGVCVELLANSDNVIRCGLTPKHVDVVELLRITDARPHVLAVQRPSSPVHTFDVPVPDFSLTRVELSASPVVAVEGPAIVLVTEGSAWLDGHGRLDRGQPAFVRAIDGPCLLRSRPPRHDAEVDATDTDEAVVGLAWVARPGREVPAEVA